MKNVFRLLFAASLMGIAVSAQTAGTSALAGTVRDTTGAAVASADIELTDVARGLKRTAQANGEGAFLFPDAHTRRLRAAGEQAGL